MLNFLLPLAGSIISGLFNRGPQQQAASAAQQASEGQTAIAQAERDLINTLLSQYGGVFQPLERAVASALSQAVGLPVTPTAQYVVANLLQPNAYQQVNLQTILSGLANMVDELAARSDLSEGQKAELAQRLGEQALSAVSNMNIQSNLLQDQRMQQALGILTNLLGQAGQYTALGRDITGQAMGGLQNLGNMYGTAGYGASQALASMGNPFAGVQQVLQNYAMGLYNPQRTAAPTPGIDVGAAWPAPSVSRASEEYYGPGADTYYTPPTQQTYAPPT